MKRKDNDRINENAAVFGAMLAAGFKAKKPNLSPTEFAKAYGREAARQQRRYCDAFALWQGCRKNRCRRARRCLGYVTDCLKRALRTVPGPAHVKARNALMQNVPRNISAAERKARQNLPADFYEKKR